MLLGADDAAAARQTGDKGGGGYPSPVPAQVQQNEMVPCMMTVAGVMSESLTYALCCSNLLP
jgi:hypothetical protein